jgi:hypothetical protein
MVMPVGNSPREPEKPRIVIFDPRSSIMRALISGFALLTFLAATALPVESFAQANAGGTTAMAPDTGTAATSTTKKSKKSSKSHAKKKSKKAPATQTSSAKQQHHSMNTSKRLRHSTG